MTADAPLLLSALDNRADIQSAIEAHLDYLSEPGYWWTASEKIAIAAESRLAKHCRLCDEKKAALSRRSVQAQHAPSLILDEKIIDMIHQIITDQGRITRAQVDALEKDGLSKLAYVELVCLVVCIFSIDEFHRALDLAPPPLPQPKLGVPSQSQPPSLEQSTGFVPMIPKLGLTVANEDLWPTGFGANVVRALSATPDLVRQWKRIAGAFYLHLEEMGNLVQANSRVLNRLQMELIAGRVSAINRCFY